MVQEEQARSGGLECRKGLKVGENKAFFWWSFSGENKSFETTNTPSNRKIYEVPSLYGSYQLAFMTNGWEKGLQLEKVTISQI